MGFGVTGLLLWEGGLSFDAASLAVAFSWSTALLLAVGSVFGSPGRAGIPEALTPSLTSPSSSSPGAPVVVEALLRPWLEGVSK